MFETLSLLTQTVAVHPPGGGGGGGGGGGTQHFVSLPPGQSPDT